MTNDPFLAGPLGVTLSADGACVRVMSTEAERIELCLFDEAGRETRRVALKERTGDLHAAFVPGLAAGQRYGLRAHGPWRPQDGLRFNPAKLLVDPYATRLERPEGLTSGMQDKGAEGFDDLALDPTDTAPFIPKGIMEAPAPARARGPSPAFRIVYELHVKGFTQAHPEIPPALRGTFAGLAHPAAIEHLTRLGVTTVELMPAAAWVDERHLPPLGLSNFWGYNPVAWLAPDPRLAPGGMAEVAAVVEALHAAGLEVILDVVFNHTAESDERGQTFSLRGLDNRTYYRLADDPRFYVNDTGCGHTLALDRPAPMRLVLDCLRHWALAGGIDGFRFDLAPVLGRTTAGFSHEAPLLAAIEQDPVLRERVMIAEPWDIGPGGYRLGDFPGRWGEWSDRYRDDVRRVWRGDAGIGTLATRLAGSSDIFAGRRRRPSASVNFVAAHDGFTLADAVAHERKHNEANGEGNRDGHGGEVSWNNGAEGATDDPAIREARRRDARALVATLLLSRGTPMLAMGDESGRTQGGNNNAYAQDNGTTWFDWGARDTELEAFVAGAIALRRSAAVLTDDRFLTGETDAAGLPDVAWLGRDGRPLDEAGWNAGAGVLGMALGGGGGRILAWFNVGREAVTVVMPEPVQGRWRQVLSSGASAPDGVLHGLFDPVPLGARSVAVFVDEAGRAPSPAVPTRDAEPAMIDRLAELAGIAPAWWQVGGPRVEVSIDTKRAILAGMGLPCATAAQVRESHARLIETGATMSETASPGAAYLPPGLETGGRRFGLSAQLYTLRREGDQGVGDFTTLRRLADAAAAKGVATLALNPLHAQFPSARERASPYQPSDRRFLDPAYVDLAAVPEIALADEERTAAAALSALRLVDWPSVWRLKRGAMARGFRALAAHPARRAAFEAFRAAGGPGLARFALFQALEEEHGHTQFRAIAVEEARAADPEAVGIALYMQFLADEQFSRASDSGLSVGLYRDLAVSAASDGAEVWTTPGAFMSGVSVGAPPDPFSALGQNWFIPPLDPIALRESGYAHFRDLLRANMRHAGALRIDHAMALRRLFIIPAGAPASQGAYVRYPMEGMLAVLAEESARARCLVVGEDLGTVPDGFRGRMDAANVLSYRVLFFERDGETFRPADAYPAKAVACVATHDLPTLKGWWSGADIALDRALGRHVPDAADADRGADRAAVARLVGAPDGPMTPALGGAVHGFLGASPAALAIAQAEDFCGEADPVNVPGTDREYPNWRRRLAVPADALFETDEARAVLAAMAAQGRTG